MPTASPITPVRLKALAAKLRAMAKLLDEVQEEMRDAGLESVDALYVVSAEAAPAAVADLAYDVRKKVRVKRRRR